MTREELVQAWRAATTERQRAELESAIWRTTTPSERDRGPGGNSSIGRVLYPIIGEKRHLPELRLRLLRAGSEVLWGRVDGPEKMPLYTAVRLIKQARAHDPGLAFDQALTLELEAYDKLLAVGAGKAVYRRSAPRKRTARATWGAVRAAVNTVVERELRGVNDRARERLKKQMEIDITILFDALNSRVHHAKTAGNSHDELPQATRADRNALRDACQTLALNPPKPGKAVDGVLAKKNFRRLVHECHPDIAGDAGRPQYEAVVAAYRHIENYNSGIADAAQRETHHGATDE